MKPTDKFDDLALEAAGTLTAVFVASSIIHAFSHIHFFFVLGELSLGTIFLGILFWATLGQYIEYRLKD